MLDYILFFFSYFHFIFISILFKGYNNTQREDFHKIHSKNHSLSKHKD